MTDRVEEGHMKQPRPPQQQTTERAMPFWADQPSIELDRVFVRAHGLPKGSLTQLSIEHDVLIKKHRDEARFE